MGLISTRVCDVIGKMNLHKLIHPSAVKCKHTAEKKAVVVLGSGPEEEYLKSTSTTSLFHPSPTVTLSD